MNMDLVVHLITLASVVVAEKSVGREQEAKTTWSGRPIRFMEQKMGK